MAILTTFRVDLSGTLRLHTAIYLMVDSLWLY